jgi:hypothetical protein
LPKSASASPKGKKERKEEKKRAAMGVKIK